MKSPGILLIAATISLILMNVSTIAGPLSKPPGQSDRIQRELGDLLPNAQGGDVKSMRILGNMLFECLYKDLDPSDPEPDYCVGLTLDDRRTAYHWLEMAAKHGTTGDAITLLSALGRTARAEPSYLNRPEISQLVSRAFQYAEDALSAGESIVLLILANLHEAGILVQQDFEAAFAYEFAYSLANDDDNGVALDRLAVHLTDDQIVVAEAAGQDIFVRCCADATNLNNQ